MAFVIVIGMMVTGYSVFSIYSDFRQTRLEADQKVGMALSKIDRDNSALKFSTQEFSNIAISNQTLTQAFARRDRGGVANALNAVIKEQDFPGFATIIDEDKKVFYSTETPTRSGDLVQSEAVKVVFDVRDRYAGPSDFSTTQTLTMSTVVPIIDEKKNMKGVLVVSQPYSSEYLTGEITKFAIEEPDPVQKIDLMVFSVPANKIVAATAGLGGGNGGSFVQDLSKRGLQAMPSNIFGLVPNAVTKLLIPINAQRVDNVFESGGRWWCKQPVTGLVFRNSKAPPKTYGYFFISTPVPDVTSKIVTTLLVAAAFGGVSLLLAFVFSHKISNSVNEPLHFLIDRTGDIADKKRTIPPLEGLSGDWLELGELIDTAVNTMRSSTQNLKQTLSKQKDELEEKAKFVEQSSTKIESLNRQITTQSRQLTEVSKQINQANRQAVVVQHKLDAVLQCSSEGFLILDGYGNILSANPVFLAWVGCSEGEIAGRLCYDLVKKPGEPRTRSMFGQAFAKHGDVNSVAEQFSKECIVYHMKEENHVEVLANLQPIVGEDNNVQGYVMVLRDKSIRSENTQLRQEIVVMLQDAIRAQLAEGETRWGAVMSSSAMSTNLRPTLVDLHNVYTNLLAVVDSYLMIYGGFVPPPVMIPKEQIVVTGLVKDCLEEVTPLARERQLALDYKTVASLPSINGNRDAVRGILIEVLHRLILITGAGGRVRVESAIRGEEMRISVWSSGPALPPEEIEDMFVGFVQGKHSEDTYSARLSMYLARNNVERLGGKIWAEGGRGTSIYFTLPVHMESAVR